MIYCVKCPNAQSLPLNPKIIGPLSDETGTVAAGKVTWSDRAWTELLFGKNHDTNAGKTKDDQRAIAPPDSTSPNDAAQDSWSSWKQLTTLDADTLRHVEERLLYSRVTLTFGWSIDVARLCILGVEW